MQVPVAPRRSRPGATPRDPDVATALGLVRSGRIRAALSALTAIAKRYDGDARKVVPLVPSDAAVAITATIDCRLARGEIAEAMAAGDELAPHLAEGGTAAGFAHFAKGELAAAVGDPELAIEHLTSVPGLLPPDPAGGDLATLLPWRASAALALVRVGRARDALALAEEWLEVAERSGSTYALAHALRTLAGVEAGANRVARLRTARAVLEELGAARLAAQVDTDLAGLLILDPAADRSEAVALLRGAEEYASREELWPLQGRVRRLLDRVSEPPRRPPGEALASLTAAERRVARLAAGGRTNRQVAAELAVTVKAVEWHLSNVYRKLGISSRTGLASALGSTT